MKHLSTGTICLLAAALAGCASSPADYASTLSRQDPKWRSPQCQQMRMAAANYEAGEPQTIGMGTGLLLGPYGLGIALAGKEHREKQRKLFARELHMQCSSRPLPRELHVSEPAPQESVGR